MKNLSRVRSIGRLSKAALIVGAAGAAAVIAAGPASAATAPTYGKSLQTGAGLKGTSVAHYDVAYTDPVFGPVHCIGVHQTGKNLGTQDSFTCTSTTGNMLSNVTLNQNLTAANTGGGWDSDYNGVFTINLSGTVSADGMSYTAVATY